MKKIDIVLGLGFGDEGKGNITNALCTKDSLVIQFNGGHQKGHTVLHNDVDHIFSSFGAGTLKGAASYISEYCTINPLAFMNEYRILESKGITPVVYVNKKAMLTTEFDIIYNQTIETQNHYGTVGVGFGSTVKRNEKFYHLHAMDIDYPYIFTHRYNNLIHNYYNYSDREKKSVNDQEWLEAVEEFKSKITLINSIDDITDIFDHFVFEGSQGIMLDQHYGFFPNVTRSNTTSQNAFEIINNSDLQFSSVPIDTYYVSRAYATKHGAGYNGEPKIATQYTKKIYDAFNKYMIKTKDDTNVWNKYQGDFNTGFLILDNLKYAINCDKIHNKSQNYNVIFTCMDHLSTERLSFLTDNSFLHGSIKDVDAELGIKVLTCSTKEFKFKKKSVKPA